MPADSIEDLYKSNLELRTVRHCSTALARLARYALGPNQAVLNPDEYKDGHIIKKPLRRPIASSWSDINTATLRSSIPTRAQQANALDQLGSHYVTQRLRNPAYVNGETAIQFESRHPIHFYREFMAAGE